MNKRIFSLVLALITCISAWAALPATGVYRIKNALHNRYLSENFSSKKCAATPLGDNRTYDQLWEVSISGSAYHFRNVFTGDYLQQQKTISAAFPLGSSADDFTLTETSDGHILINFSGYIFCDNSYNIINWYDTSTEASHWSFESVSMTSDEIASARTEYDNLNNIKNNTATYTTALMNFFEDYACTSLKSEYRSASDDKLRTDMAQAGLPASLQDIAVKVKNDKFNGYEKQFRIHQYEPYSDANTWAGKLRSTGFSYMNNPTGIYCNSRQMLYVFVDSDIPSDATLYIGSCIGNDLINNRYWGTKLVKGLNAILVSQDQSLFYVIYTVNTDGMTKKISDWSNVKIHIEGGVVNGYYDASHNDDSEYAALLNNATHPLFTVKGTHAIFNFQTSTYRNIWPTTIQKSIKWFDNVHIWESETMGILDDVANGKCSNSPANMTGGKAYYPTYCNNSIFAIQGASNTNLNSTTYRTSYPGEGGVRSSFNAEVEGLGNWATAHEVGHNNQGAINLEGSTEASNNLFSNIVCYRFGYRMSRGNTIAYTMNDLAEGKPWCKRDIGSMLRMYYQLYMYYHMARNNTSFYPTLFNLLRDDPMVLGSGKNSILKFVEKVCEAANEDLTDFFTAWGFFVPLDKVYVSDYSSYTITVTQDDIDATKAKIAKYPRKNREIMLIEDRIKETPRFDDFAEPGETRAVTDRKIGECGDLGQFTDFMNENVVAGNYIYAPTGESITMYGEGGVGFIVVDNDGNFVTASNCLTFPMPSNFTSGGYKILVINGDGTTSECGSVAENGTDAQKLDALNKSLATASEIIKLNDPTGMRIGFYKESDIATLISLSNNAKAIIAANNASLYGEYITNISNEIARIKQDVKRTPLKAGNSYSIKSSYYDGRYMIYDSSNNNFTSTTSTDQTDAKMFTFIESDVAGKYYIQNKLSGRYIKNMATSTVAKGTETRNKNEALGFYLTDNGNGTFRIQSQSRNGYEYVHVAASQSWNIVGWSGSADASQWYITTEEEHSFLKLSRQLNALIVNTDELASSVASYASDPIKANLQVSNGSGNYYLSTNAKETSAGALRNLLDGSTSTYFISTCTAATSAYHYLQIDCGENNLTNSFKFSYSTRNGFDKDKPSKIEVAVSNSGDNNSFKTIQTLTSNDSNPLPSNTSTTSADYNSGVITADDNFRYIRFTVKETNTNRSFNNSGYYYFSLSRFSFFDYGHHISLKPSYSFLEGTGILEEALTQMRNSQSLIDNPTMSPYDLMIQTADLQKAYDALSNFIVSGIDQINTDRTVEDDAIYDLQGRRVTNPTNGIYIRNGKKLIIRNH